MREKTGLDPSGRDGTRDDARASDEFFMRRALELAGRGRGTVRPNPLVGAVLAMDGKIMGEGWHQRAGGPHAEVLAVADADARAMKDTGERFSEEGRFYADSDPRDAKHAGGQFRAGRADLSRATLYVTLEPCCHTGRTPPCADLIIARGIGRVVCAMEDPDERVSGGGIAALRAAGIPVTTGVLERECRELNSVFVKYATTGRPWVLLKSAMSLDGKTATAEGRSRWISSGESRADVHRLRSEFAGILSGIGTVLADDPLYTVRLGEGAHPGPATTRIIADTFLKLPLSSRIAATARSVPTIVAAGESALEDPQARARRQGLESLGITVLPIRDDGRRIDLAALMHALGRLGIDSVLLESGGTLAASALEAGIVDRVRIYVAPIILGGSSAASPVAGKGVRFPEDGWRIDGLTCSACGPDLVLEGSPCSRA